MTAAFGNFAARWEWLQERGMSASVVVAALSAAFGVILVEGTAYIAAVLRSYPEIGDSGTFAVVSGVLAALLTVLSLYVAAIVTANMFSAVVVSRTQQIALLRVIGASARSQRDVVARQGAVVGTLGAIVGVVAGVGLSVLGALIAARVLGVVPLGFTFAQPALILPAVGVIITTWAAAWVGSRRVLTVTPVQAWGGSVDLSFDAVRARRGRHVGASVTLGVGVLLLASGVILGLVSPLAVVIAFIGGLLSFTGLVVAAPVIVPGLLRLVGLALGRGAMARMAAENALRYPERSSRTVIGLVVGVTLVTMFTVAAETAKTMFTAGVPAGSVSDIAASLDAFAALMVGMVSVAAVIAGIGLVNLLTVGVVQRRRELALLRAVGLTARQLRSMVRKEAVHMTLTALLFGLTCGAVYGWVGAQSVLGSVSFDVEVGPVGLIAPALPWPQLVAIVIATAVLTLVASAAPMRLAARVTPVAALASV